MKITIEVIPHYEQRYPTAGDWQWRANGDLDITISEMNNYKFEFLVAFHELIEVMLCRARSIPQREVDEFDIKYEAQRLVGDLSEPGDSPDAPYNKEHFFATNLERLMADELGADWSEYESTVASL